MHQQFPDKTEEQVQTEVDNFLSGKDNIIADTNTTNTTNNTNMMQTTGDAATGGLSRDEIIAQAMADAKNFLVLKNQCLVEKWLQDF